LDRAHGLGLETLEPGSGSYDRVRSASKLVFEIMNSIERLLPEGPMLYEHIIMLGEDGEALISRLLVAKHYEAEEEAGRISKITRILAQKRKADENSPAEVLE